MALNFNAIQRAAAFAPATAFPLDARSYFESYDLAVAAAATAAEPGTDAASNTVYYFGETLVVNEGGKATLYIIQPNGTLKEVGSVPVGDGKSIEVVNGQIKLKGFGTGYYQYNTNYVPGSTEEGTKDQYVFVEEGFKAGLQPQVVAKASGEGFEIAWYEPNPTTVEGLQSQITALDGSVNNLTSKIDTKADASDLALYQTRALPSIEGYASGSLSVEGALLEVMSKAVANETAITSHQASYESLSSDVESIDGRVNTIEGAYASTGYVNDAIDGLANVYETVSNVNAKLANYYTKEQADEKHEEVVEISQGKTQTFVVNCEDNEFLRLKDAELHVQQFITIDGKAITADTLKAGDVILVVETDVPDRWVKEVGDRGYFVLAALETTKVDLNPYATTSYVNQKLLNYISGSISTVDKLVLVAGNNQIKETEYTIINSFTTGNSTTIPTTKAVFDSISNATSDRATKKSVSDEASAREAADNALGKRISTEESHRVTSDQALGKRIDDEISARETLAERVETLEAKPFDTYATKSELDAEAKTRKDADDALDVRLADVEAQLGISDGSESGSSLTEQVSEVIKEVWGVSDLSSFEFTASSRIDNHEGRIESIEDKVTSTLATKEYVGEQIQSAEHVISVKTDDTDFFEITKGQDDVVTINVKDDIENIIASAVTLVVSGGQYVSATISSHGLTINDSNLVSVISSMASNPVISVRILNENLEVTHHDGNTASYNLIEGVFGSPSVDIQNILAVASFYNDNSANIVTSVSGGDFVYASLDSNLLTLSINTENFVSELTTEYASTLASGIASQLPSNEIIKHVFGVESIASNAVALVSSVEIVSALDDLGHNHDAIKSAVQKAVTSVQTSTLVVSHVGNNLTINLPSEIWLDGGNAAGAYEAEEAVYNELLNNEYGN